MKPCIFCGQIRKLNKEHIFPQWLQRYLGVEKMELRISTGSSPEFKRSFNYLSHVNGLVCEECNTKGWMCELERKVKPIIISLIEDQSLREITFEDSKTLAWWVFKTVLTLHSVSLYEKVIPEEHYHLAYRRIAPPYFTIAIGRLATPLESPSWIQNQNWVGAEKHVSGEKLKAVLMRTYRVTIGFKNLAARVAYFPLEEMHLFPLEDGVQIIHPRQKKIIWPPSNLLEDLWELDQGLVIT